jgi:hypothetical protein
MTDTPDPSAADRSGGETLKANTFGPDQIKVGMMVTAMDGDTVGKVKVLHAQEFLIDRPMAPDLWVPYASVFAVKGRGGTFRRGPVPPDQVVLSVTGAHVDRQGWRRG